MHITIDRNTPTVATDTSWQFGMGNDHAFQLHRKDALSHVKLAHDQLGIKYLRFHGIFDDDMLCVQTLYDYRYFRAMPGAKQIKEINFRQIGDIFDNLLEIGVRPFVELSFMPSALSKGKKTGLRYANNNMMPRSLDEWAAFIRSFIRFLLDRYGEEEVENWYFEVWNEPDLGIFFSGTQSDYFKLYETTAKAVKSVDSRLRVGGPSTSGCKWIPEFLDYCKKTGTPVDFVSTHHYPGDAFGNMFTAGNAVQMMKDSSGSAKNGVNLTDTMRKLFFHPEVYKKWPKGQLAKMDAVAKAEAGELPLFMSEWNSMAVFASPVHDEKYSAAFAAKSVLDLSGLCSAYMFWCCSDIYEEQFMLPKPFSGSFGVVTNDGIPKPNFWAFKMLSELYPKRLQVSGNEEVDLGAFTDGENVQLLITPQSGDYDKDQQHEISIELDFEASSATVQIIDDDHCNPKKEWKKMGSPDNLTREQVTQIKESTALKEEPIPFEAAEGKTLIKLVLHTNDVALITVKS